MTLLASLLPKAANTDLYKAYVQFLNPVKLQVIFSSAFGSTGFLNS